MFVTPNLGNIDRLIRLVAGALLIVAPYMVNAADWEYPVARWGAPIVGTVLVLTAFLRCCPVYRLLGISSCRLG